MIIKWVWRCLLSNSARVWMV